MAAIRWACVAAKVFVVFLVVFDPIKCDSDDSSNKNNYVNFVLVGATGSLAKKYLWQGLYDLHDSGSAYPVRYFGGARAAYEQGHAALLDILNDNVKYNSESDRSSFSKLVKFFQLKTLEHYGDFCHDTLNDLGYNSVVSKPQNDDEGVCETKSDCQNSGREAGRIFYLAVPPHSYGEMADWLHRVCRPSDPDAWIRVVLEKPYGTDSETVDALVRRLKENFAPHELYLVDHYLGKAAAQQILPLRFANNSTLETFLNNEFVERIEVVVKEAEDAEGRMAFYDSYGVFLDILQNHAMEMLTLVTMDLPSDLSDPANVRRRKTALLESVIPVHPDRVVAAQYEDYVRHGREEFKDPSFESKTATFGAVALQLSCPRWSGVPVYLVSGKALDTKASYIRVLLKSGPSDDRSGNELVISFGPRWPGCELSGPCLVVPKRMLAGSALPITSWHLQGETADGHSVVYHPGKEDRAYSVVIADLVHGRQENFVHVDSLSASWELWNLVLQRFRTPTAPPPPLYGRGDLDSLRLRLAPSGLSYVDAGMRSGWPEPLARVHDVSISLGGGLPVTEVVVRPAVELMESVAVHLRREAVLRLTAGSNFHLAVPGGRTPRTLFQILASDRSFPWSRTDLWFTDERCVPPSHHQSNFHGAQRGLLRHVSCRVHPMPVRLARGLCDPADQGAQLYSAELAEHVGGGLDVVLLGVGGDGHVASLFPGTGGGAEVEENVVLVDPPAGVSPDVRRMSLSAGAIAAARKVFVVISGKDKHGVVQEILNGSLTPATFPVKGVKAAEGVTVFIDEDAYFG